MYRSGTHLLPVALLLSTSSSGTAFAAKPKLVVGSPPIAMQQVAEAPGKTAEELFRRAEIWLDSQDATHLLKDPDNGRLSGELSIPFDPPDHQYEDGSAYRGMAGRLTYSVTVEVQDDKYRVTIGDFVHKGSDSVRPPSGTAAALLWPMPAPTESADKFSMGTITSDSICPCEEQKRQSHSSDKAWQRKANDGWRLRGWNKAQQAAKDQGARVFKELAETISATAAKDW